MKKALIFVLTLSLFSCSVRRVDVSGSKYSTGHMGMVGENTFVFKNENEFYYYDRLTYSEGTFEWVDVKNLRLTSKVMGGNIFENFVIANFQKFNENRYLHLNYYFWQDHNGLEIDLLLKTANAFDVYESNLLRH